MSRRTLVTLHDVAPHTLEDCLRTLDALDARGVEPVTLLVVPGAGWDGHELDTLRGLAERHPVAGHGWGHRAIRRDEWTPYHRLHAALISRDQAEHLSRSNDELRGLVGRCAHWFREVGLEVPSLYVPPAWALGRLSADDLAELPFRYYATLTGIRDAATGEHRALPLVGYLADTRRRAWALRGLNALNGVARRVMRRPLRIAVHPPDLRLRLADRMLRTLDGDWEFVTVAGAMGGPVGERRSQAARGAPDAP